MDHIRVNKIVLLMLVIFVSAVFVTMIRQFLMAILLAGIFSGLFQPVYQKLGTWLGGRRSLASAVTILLIFLLIFLPFLSLLGVVTAQAVKVGQRATPWIKEQLQEPSLFNRIFESLPFHDTVLEYRGVILEKAEQLVSGLSSVMVNSVSAFTLSTVNFLFLFFIFMYTLFFFLKDGRLLIKKILFYLPLKDEDEQKLLDKFTSVTRATLKGTLVIGLIQGTLAGLAFWVAGIPSALFWGTLMVVLSVIPMIGSPLVWVPAAIIWGASGHVAAAVGLVIFCGALVGSLDNILRPILVGKDTRMHELFILFGTIGGISMFGIIGFVVGPIVAALFITVWEIYGETFKAHLPGDQAPQGLEASPDPKPTDGGQKGGNGPDP
jgi:predicted PurR-regulated permease PerM